MSFAYPIFLWGLTALAIPIIVHLFNFRKAKKVSFSNVRFLESIKKKSSSNLRLRHLLILACRLLFVFFLVLTFAQPFIASKEDGLQNKSVSIYVDNSNSLSNLTEADISGFNELLAIAQEVVLLYPQETQFRLITNDFLPGDNINRSKAKTLERLTEIEYSNLSRSGHDMFSKVRDNSTNEPRDIFILSDFQRSTIGEFDSFVDSTNRYHLIRADMAQQRNIYVDTIFLSNPFLVPNQKNAVSIRVKNEGPAVNDLQLKFFINERQSGTISIDIEANAAKDITFELTGPIAKTNRCLISFEDFPVVFDNDYYFALNRAAKINIAEVTGYSNSAISRVFQDNDLFQFSTFYSENISYPVLEKADLVIINNINKIENGLKAQIEKHLSLGKSVIIIPGDKTEGPYKIADLELVRNSSPSKSPLALPDLRNPFFANIFESLSNETQMPEVAPIHTWRTNDVKLLKTKTGQSFLSHIFQKGNLYVFAAPMESDYTDFHLHSLFVPVMHRIAELSGTNNQALAFDVDESNLSLTVDSIPNRQLYTLKKENTELIPSQRISANELILDMPKYLLSEGYYDLTLGDQPITTIAFNHSKKESELSCWPVEEIEARLSGLKHLNLYQSQDQNSFSKIMKEKYHQRELWKYALILSLIFLFAESVLLRFL